MGKKDYGSFIFYLGLSLGYVAAVCVMLVFFHNLDRRNRIMAEYEQERTAFTFLELFREGWLPETLAENKNLRGFGIYSNQGKNIFTWGSAPGSLTDRQLLHLPQEDNYRYFLYTNAESLQLIMRIYHLPGRQGPLHRMMQRRQESPAYIFIERANTVYWRSHRNMVIASILLPVLLLVFLVLSFILYKKNHDYRQRLKAQAELVRLGEISRTLSHEIKNPLSAIRIQTGILKRTMPITGNTPQEINIIEEEVERLGLLTRRISDFVKDPLGNPEKIHIEDFLEELILRFEVNIKLDNKSGRDLTVYADRERLRSVLENVIKNGIESYPPGSPLREGEPHLEIRLNHEEGETEIVILDRGSGIDPALKDKVFTPDYSSKLAGSGVGLAISQRFMEVLGGRIELKPRASGGTEAHIHFGKEPLRHEHR